MTGTERRVGPAALAGWLVPLALAGLVAVAWVVVTGGGTLARTLGTAHPVAVLAMVGITAAWFFLRFLRSQYLLRRAGVRIPIRPALHTYLAALAGTATPAYLGEAIRSLFLRRRFGAPVRVTLAVLVLERLLDVAALAILLLVATRGEEWQLGLGFLLGAPVAAACLWPLFHRFGVPVGALAALRRPGALLVGVLSSCGAWILAASLYGIGAAGLGYGVGLGEGAGVYTQSTLLGALTLLPAGVGATGSLAILELRELGLPLAQAVSLVTLVRLLSTGIALVVGAAFLALELRGTTSAPEGVAHFDTIATEYQAQWSPHVWALLLDRKISLMTAELPAPPAAAGRGLDLGCGLGLQAAEMRRRGYQVVGLEPSAGLLARREDRALPAVAGDALTLPFRTGSFDFVYAVGVLHHLPGRDAQAAALLELRRVLRPGGRLLVHESNPRNPFFRFYMGYLFPILKRIDEGTEWWLPPRSWAGAEGFRLEVIRYFTFLPDFIPGVFMRPALALERWLERGPTAPWSAHYLAVLRREG